VSLILELDRSFENRVHLMKKFQSHRVTSRTHSCDCMFQVKKHSLTSFNQSSPRIRSQPSENDCPPVTTRLGLHRKKYKRGISWGRYQSIALPIPTNNIFLPIPTYNIALPIPTYNIALHKPTYNIAIPKPTYYVALLIPTYNIALPIPTYNVAIPKLT